MDSRDDEERMYDMIDEVTGGQYYDGAAGGGDDDGSQYLNLDEANGRDNYDEFFGGANDGDDGGDTIAKSGEVYKASADHDLVDALVDSYIYTNDCFFSQTSASGQSSARKRDPTRKLANGARFTIDVVSELGEPLEPTKAASAFV